MGEIVFLIAGWDGRTKWNGGGMEGTILEGADGASPLSLEVRRVTGSSGQRWEAVAAINCVSAAKTRSICVRAPESSK